MVDAISVSLSALSAATRKTSVAANNIANAGSAGTRDTAYTPQDVINVTNETGGVSTRVQNRDPAHVLIHDPGSPQADSDGNVAVPNVDLVTEAITMKTAEIAYRASAKVMGVAHRMQDDLQRLFDEKA